MRIILSVAALAGMGGAYGNENAYSEYDQKTTSKSELNLHFLNTAGLHQHFEIQAPWPESSIWLDRTLSGEINFRELNSEYNDPFTSDHQKSEIEGLATQFVSDLNNSAKYILNEFIVKGYCSKSHLDPDTQSIWIGYPALPSISAEISNSIYLSDSGLVSTPIRNIERQYDYNPSFSFASRDEYNEFLEEFHSDFGGTSRSNGGVRCVVTYEPQGIVEGTDLGSSVDNEYVLAVQPVNVKLFSTIDGAMLVDWEYPSN